MAVEYQGQRYLVVGEHGDQVTIQPEGEAPTVDNLVTVHRAYFPQLEEAARAPRRVRFGGDEGRMRRANRTGLRRSRDT